MEKSKLGVSVGLIGALAFLLTLFSGYTVSILIVGYVLLCEESSWLKKVCVKAIFLALCFDIVHRVIGFITDLLSWIGSLTAIFDHYFDYSVVSNLLSLITKPLTVIEVILFLVLGLMALKQKTINISFIDKLID